MEIESWGDDPEKACLHNELQRLLAEVIQKLDPKIAEGLSPIVIAKLLSANRPSHLAKSATTRIRVFYNSFTGQGQLLWVGVCLQQSFGRGLAWCPWCPLTSEFSSTGLKQATQANRLNLRKASKDAGFR